MSSKVAFGLIPVPVEEVSSLQEGTKLTELLANHVTDFIQMSSFVEGLSYGFLVNLPGEEYKVHNAPWLHMQDHLKRFGDRDESIQYTTFPVILAQSGSQLSFHPVKPLKQLTWSDIDDLLKHMDFASTRKLKYWKSEYDVPYKWALKEMDMNTNPFYRGEQ